METIKKDVIELRSEEVQEIMGQVPSWILRCGISIICTLLVVLILGSCFFKYPDILTAEIQVTTQTPPIELYSRATGKLEEMTARHQQDVKQGEVLAVIESTADFRDIAKVEEAFSQWQQGKLSDIEVYHQLYASKLRLGDLQSSFAAFMSALNKEIYHATEHYYPQKIALKTRQQGERKDIEAIKVKEMGLHRQQSDISKIMFKRDSVLFSQKLISEEEYNTAERNYLQSREVAIGDATTLQQLQMEELAENEIMLDLRQQFWLEESDVALNLASSAEQLENAIMAYEKTYVLRTPIAGKVNMMGRWKKNQTVNSGDLMMIVIPNEEPVSVGRAKLPAAGAGKVRIGQKVKTRITNFPDTEYGYVSGVVSSVSAIPDKDSNYYLEVEFPNGLSTNYGKVLPQTKEMLGTAEIVVKDKRLIENFIQPVEKLLRE